MVLEINKISKKFGSHLALDSMTFTAQQGEVIGIIGPNGAGKTTFFNILLGLIKPTSGDFKVFGKTSIVPVAGRIGVSLEDYGFYPYLSGWDNLKIAANIKGVGKSEMEKAMKLVELYEKRDMEVKKYSFGMVKRLSIACALLNNPELIILDEPTNGLDPLGIRKMRNLIKQLAKEGKTIIIANHLLGEIEKVCDKIILLKEGKTIKVLKTEDIGKENCFELYSDKVEELKSIFIDMDDISILDVDLDNIVITSTIENNIPKLILSLNEKGMDISHSKERSVTLEDIFYSSLLVSENKKQSSKA